MSDILTFLGGGSPFTTVGLTLWLDAEFNCYVDAGVTLCTNGQTIYRWTSRVASRYAEQTTAGTRPTYSTNIRNGHAVANFIADGDWLVAGALGGNFYSSDILAGSAFTVLYAGMRNTGGANNSILSPLYVSDGGGTILWCGSGTNYLDNVDCQHRDSGGVDDCQKTAGVDIDVWHIGTVMHDGTNIYTGYNDTRTASLVAVASGATVNGYDTGDSVYVGWAGVGSTAYLGDAIVWNVALSEADRKVAEQYLASKYAITLPY